VLSTFQVQSLLFPSLRGCQRRLARLHRLGFLDRFRGRDARGGSLPWRWTPGPLGVHLQAAAAGRAAPSPRQLADRLARVATDPQLSHRLGTSQFFVDLHSHALTDPGVRLARWWGEPWAASLLRGVRPDGHGWWHAAGVSVAWFLEYDTGAMDLPRLVAKLAGYDRAARCGGPAWPVLLWLHSPVREANLHRLLAGATGRCPVATAARPAAPAAPVWRLVGDPTGRRRRLHELGGLVEGAPARLDWRDDYTTDLSGEAGGPSGNNLAGGATGF
jgi:hypothetical protein